MKNSFLILAVASCVSATGHAEDPRPANANLPSRESLLACSKLQDTSERARCYDALVAGMNASTGSASARSDAAAAASRPSAATAASASATRGVVSAAPKTSSSASSPPAAAGQSSAEAKFGEEFLPPASRPELHEPQPTLFSSITSMRVVGPNQWVISLANGQVWRHEGGQTAAFFRTGDDVRIDRGALGSYKMSTPRTGAKNWVRVTRIR